ncbi:heparan-alpha-glucosaminide N-acetyltransferase domain-containing protein [Buchananella felis]|uniref:heparan-alpha-glucosaminide N-acetyltransferase domain-containing protein n=1 Tax=Buchananella felis TaxID=3231492 RepID=UPI00352947FE
MTDSIPAPGPVPPRAAAQIGTSLVDDAAAPTAPPTQAALPVDQAALPAHANAPESKSPWTQKPRPWWPQLRKGPYLGGAGRVTGLDAARGIALLGMVIAHAGAIDAVGNTPRWLGFAHGRASILFAMVAGISLAIITGGTRPREGEYLLRDRLRIFTRAVVLLVLASVLETLATPIAVILGAYALWFVLALPFVRCSVRALLAWGFSFAALGSTAIFLVEEASVRFGYYPGGSPGNGFLSMLFVSVYPAVVWMGFVLIGMAIGRSDLTKPRVLLAYGVSGLLLFAAFAAPFVAKDGVNPLLRIDVDNGIVDPFGSYPGISVPIPPQPSPEPLGPDIRGLAAATTPPPGLEEGVTGNDITAPSDFMCMEDGELYPCTGEEFGRITTTWTEEDWRYYDGLMGPQEFVPGEDSSFWQRYVSHVFTMDPHTGSPFEALSSGGFAMAVIAGCVAIGRRLKYALAPLAAVGSMSLTAYTIHVVTTAVLTSTGYNSSNAPLIWQAVGLSVFALVWAWFFQRGPLEQAMASWADRGSSLPRSRGRD